MFKVIKSLTALFLLQRKEEQTMAIKAISHSYWRSIKNGNRTFESIPASVKEDVLFLAKTDVENGVISAEEYEQLIGQPYEA